MQVSLLSGRSYTDLSPIRFETRPQPKPVFWAENAKQAIRRAFSRFMTAYGPLKPARRYSSIQFGWGDCGLGSIVTYAPIGTLHCATTLTHATWILAFYFGNKAVDAIKITTPITAFEDVIDIAVEALHVG